MTRPHRLSLLLVLLAFALAGSRPGTAQEPDARRFAFADTTLLRDTLDLRFTRLFPLADSLGLTPDSLRAFSVRYHLPLERLVALADSIGMPVDSVGPVLERERFNPLAAGAATRNDFNYNSHYTIGQTQSSWRNAADYGFSHGPIFARNSTTIALDRYVAGPQVSLWQTRSSVTEVGWRFSPNLSLGTRVNLERFDSRDPGSVLNVGENKNQYQLSLRSRHRPRSGLNTELNLFSGILDVAKTGEEKRGASGDLNGRVRHQVGTWLNQEVSAQLTGNFARTRLPTAREWLSTRDHSNNLQGTLNLFSSAPIGLRGGFTIRRVRVETLSDSATVRPVRTDNAAGDVTLRFRRDNDRYLDLTQRYNDTEQATVAAMNSRTSRRDHGFSASGRYRLRGWTADVRFSNGFGKSEFPSRSATGGYGENTHARSLDGSLTRPVGSRLTLRSAAGIHLISYRYYLIGSFATPPVSRDHLRQSLRVEGSFEASPRFSTGLLFDVTRTRLINIPSAITSANTETRSYRAEWRWSYRLLRRLTATQRSTMTADYLAYTFLPQNDRLALDYTVVTTLNAAVTPRLTVNLTHNGRTQPSGNYTRFADGLHYFSPADETEFYSLAANIAYAPSSALSLNLDPVYSAVRRVGTVNGAEVPQRDSRSLNLSGGGNLNLPVGGKGTLRADLRRAYRTDRATTFSGGLPDLSPRSELDYWNGSLTLSWRL